MSNEEIAQVFRDVYNGWWLKWREAPPSEPNLEAAGQEAYALMRKHRAESLVCRMVQDLMRIWEGRKNERL